MNGPVPVPTLDELVRDPGKVASLPPEAARTVLCSLAGLLPVLIAQSSQVREKPSTAPPAIRWLNVEQVVAQFGLTARWLYRHKHQLPYSQPSRKQVLFDEQKLVKWLTAHKGG
jgi:hypothetical protein